MARRTTKLKVDTPERRADLIAEIYRSPAAKSVSRDLGVMMISGISFIPELVKNTVV